MYRIIQLNILGCMCQASVRYARAKNKLMSSLYDPKQPTSYIMEVDANNLYCWAMSQEMPNGDFELMSQNKSREIKLHIKYADGRIAISDLGIFNHRTTDAEKEFIFEVDLKYLFEHHDRDDDYSIGTEVMKIEPDITGVKKHNLRAHCFKAACPFSLKLLCSFFPKMHYVVLGQLLRFKLDRGIRLEKVNRAIGDNSSSNVAG